MTERTTSTVLVVDDNESVADTYTAFLADEYTVRTAYDGHEALDLMDDDVDVVLLDRRMPGLSGDEVLDRIREREFDARVVMLTAVDPEFDIVAMPFDDYVVKPTDREELREVVDEMVDRANFDDDLRRFLALVSKQATLETEKTRSQLQDSDQYQAISDRIETLRDQLGVDPERLETIVERKGDDSEEAAE